VGRVTTGAAGGRYAVGIASVDALHEECEQVLAQLQAVVASGGDAGAALAAVHEHLSRHFEHEERLLMRSAAPTCACHMREHASVLEVMVEVRRRYAEGDRAPAARLAEAIFEWLDLHAHGMDAALAQDLQATGAELPGKGLDPALGVA